ncbi:FAD/NAD(P)-binding protein [Pseudomonas sp. CCOS 191]|uniref:FAD/NAD(P)-binding protein n=1 Tax=Pseudomonas sp. CCOS 191 TaxID=1649877 RepID=UPI0006248569|nr:FAD/NAD(P)-binding protein [Pseudomonas sp. CCOS 191]CRI59803.1 hypothetical protein CCOS191_5267 [Pseudomonas sp. CCOS 191]
MSRQADSVLIVGAGLSGVLTAINLLRSSTAQGSSITLLNATATFARGLAYSCSNDSLLLNVPAGNMSAFADRPSHFLEFCRQKSPSVRADSFVPRRLYGAYLEHELLQAMAEQPGRLHLQTGEAEAVTPLSGGQGYAVRLADGQRLTAQHVVLALGHQRPRQSLIDMPEGETLIDPWDFTRISNLPPGAPVLILGTGHTAVDALFHLAEHTQPSQVLMVSRRGLLPHAHRLNTTAPSSVYPSYLAAASPTVRSLMRSLRDEITNQDDWRDVLNQLRPHIPTLWQTLPTAERRRFLRHAVAFWDIHRHRLAPQAAQRLRGLLDDGKVRVQGARLLSVHKTNEGYLKIEIRPRGKLTTQTVEAVAIINCTGPEMAIGPHSSPLLRQLARDGWLNTDPCALGLKTNEQRQLIDVRGKAVDNLWYIGPMLKAEYWEAIAVPELRVHAQQLANTLAARLASPSPLLNRPEPD